MHALALNRHGDGRTRKTSKISVLFLSTRTRLACLFPSSSTAVSFLSLFLLRALCPREEKRHSKSIADQSMEAQSASLQGTGTTTATRRRRRCSRRQPPPVHPRRERKELLNCVAKSRSADSLVRDETNLDTSFLFSSILFLSLFLSAAPRFFPPPQHRRLRATSLHGGRQRALLAVEVSETERKDAYAEILAFCTASVSLSFLHSFALRPDCLKLEISTGGDQALGRKKQR